MQEPGTFFLFPEIEHGFDYPLFCHSVGREGPLSKALLGLLLQDLKSGPATVRVPVSY